MAEAEVHGLLFAKMVVEAVPFSTEVVAWISDCRLRDGGIPTFRTGFAGLPFKQDETYYIKGVCWLGANLVDSKDFKGVPKEDFEHLHTHSDDWKYLMKRYAPKQLREAVEKAPVVVV